MTSIGDISEEISARQSSPNETANIPLSVGSGDPSQIRQNQTTNYNLGLTKQEEEDIELQEKEDFEARKIKKKMNKFKQLRAIIAKEYILWMSNICEFWFLFILSFVFAIISSGNSNKTFSYIAPIIINAFVSKNIILNNCNDRNMGFRATFRLMGLSNMAYILGTMIFQLIQALGMTSLYMMIQFLLSNGSLGVLANDRLMFNYLINTYLFLFANIISCTIFSQILGRTKNVKEYMAIFLSIVTVIPIFACIKSEPDERLMAFEKYAIFIPSVAYLQDFRLNVQRGFSLYDTYPIQILVSTNIILIPSLIIIEFYKG